jgi:hypothetical protein
MVLPIGVRAVEGMVVCAHAPAHPSLSSEEAVLDVSIVVAKSSKVACGRYSGIPTQELMAGRIEREWIVVALSSSYGNGVSTTIGPPAADAEPT